MLMSLLEIWQMYVYLQNEDNNFETISRGFVLQKRNYNYISQHCYSAIDMLGFTGNFIYNCGMKHELFDKNISLSLYFQIKII